MHILLLEPEIPGNTGNIARTCAATNAPLHIIRPMAFPIDDRKMKRAGLDYWHLVKVHYHDSFDEVQTKYEGHPFYFCTTKAARIYSDISYTSDVFLVFGKETAGLPESLLAANEAHTIRIPMHEGARSLNLSNAVAVVAYEALRQNAFVELSLAGIGCGGSHKI